MRRYLPSVVIFLVAAAFTSAFYINFCATVFQCGCQSLWGDAARFCNIHNAHARHCPWCVLGTSGYVGTFGTMLVCQGVVAFGGVRWGWGWMARLAGSLAAFPLSGLPLALIAGWYTGYWD